MSRQQGGELSPSSRLVGAWGLPAGSFLGQTRRGVPPPPSNKYPLVRPTWPLIAGRGEGVGGVLFGPHLWHITQLRTVAYPDSAHIRKTCMVSGKLCWGWGCVRGKEDQNY